MWKKKIIGKKEKHSHGHVGAKKATGIMRPSAEWLRGRHWCGHGFKGWIVRSHGLTFCNLCGKEKRML
jgi:hypothetical protein